MNRRRKLLALFGAVVGDAIAFIQAVIADGGFVIEQNHTNQIFNKNRKANLICPCSAGNDGKLYFWIGD